MPEASRCLPPKQLITRESLWKAALLSLPKLRRAKSLKSAIQSQSDYAKSAYTEFVAYLVKMSDLYCNLFKRGSTPTEKAAAKIEGVKA